MERAEQFQRLDVGKIVEKHGVVRDIIARTGLPCFPVFCESSSSNDASPMCLMATLC